MSLDHSLLFIIVFTPARYSLGVSHVALVMNNEGDLLMYKNKGRPTAKEAESLEVNGNLRKELNKLKKIMGYKNGTDILLALLIASNEMVRAVYMFPEVLYMDVTSNTNKERRVFLNGSEGREWRNFRW